MSTTNERDASWAEVVAKMDEKENEIRQQNRFLGVIVIAISIVLITALPPVNLFPKWYYVFVKLALFGASVIVGLYLTSAKCYGWAQNFWITAIVFNPIAPINFCYDSVRIVYFGLIFIFIGGSVKFIAVKDAEHSNYIKELRAQFFEKWPEQTEP